METQSNIAHHPTQSSSRRPPLKEKTENHFTDSHITHPHSSTYLHPSSNGKQNKANVLFNDKFPHADKNRRPRLVPKPNPSDPLPQKVVLAPPEEKANPSSNVLPNLSLLGGKDLPSTDRKARININTEEITKMGGPLALIKAYLESGYNCGVNKETEKALAITIQARNLVDKNLKKNVQIDFEILFITYYNLISFNYKLHNLHDCTDQIKYALLNLEAYRHHIKPPTKLPLNFSTFSDQTEYLNNLAKKDKRRRYESKIHFQACILASEVGNHVKALAHAQKAAKLTFHLLYDSLLVALHLYVKIHQNEETAILSVRENKDSAIKPFKSMEKQNGLPTLSNIIQNVETKQTSTNKLEQQQVEQEAIVQKYSSSQEYDSYRNPQITSRGKLDMLEKLIPILEVLVAKIKGKRPVSVSSNRAKLMHELQRLMGPHQFGEVDMRDLYGGLPPDHFLFTSNLIGLAQLESLNFAKMNEMISLEDIIERDTIIELILLTTLSLYCISTELRFWDDMKQDDGSSSKFPGTLVKDYQPVSMLKKSSELWIGRCLEFAFVYLPHSSPLAGQIFNIYTTVYDSTKFAIPEEDEVDYQLKYLIPAKGITKSVNCFIPIIKKGTEDEIEGLELALSFNKDQTNSTRRVLEESPLIDTDDKMYETFTHNYSQQRHLQKEPFYLQALKKSFLKNKRPHSNSHLHRSLNRMSNHSPSPGDSSIQKLQRIYLGNTFVKPTFNEERDASSATQQYESLQKDNSELDLRVVTDPGVINEDLPQPNIKDFSSNSQERASLNRLRPKLHVGVDDIRKSLKTTFKPKEDVRLPEHPIKAISSSQLMVKPTKADGDRADKNTAVNVNVSINLGKKTSGGTKAEISLQASFENCSKSSVKATIRDNYHSHDGTTNRDIHTSVVNENTEPVAGSSRLVLKSSLEKIMQKHTLGHLVGGLSEKKLQSKPLKPHIEGNLRTFFKKSLMGREKNEQIGQLPNSKNSEGKKKANLSSDMMLVDEDNNNRSRSNERIPIKPIKQLTKYMLRSGIPPRPSSSLRPRMKAEDGGRLMDSSTDSDSTRMNLMNLSSVTKETAKKVEILGAMRSISAGKRGVTYKQRASLLKKNTEPESR